MSKPPAKPSNRSDDEALFRKAMADVTPLQHDTVELRPKPPRPQRRAATPDQPPAARQGFIEHQHLQPLKAEDALFFARPGLQQRLLRRLKRGEIPIEARLDLHGMSIAQAGAQLETFLALAESQGLRHLLLIHGKGQRSGQGHSLLKTQVNHWLRHCPLVLAFATCRPQHGGSGALYLLLRRG